MTPPLNFIIKEEEELENPAVVSEEQDEEVYGCLIKEELVEISIKAEEEDDEKATSVVEEEEGIAIISTSISPPQLRLQFSTPELQFITCLLCW